MPVIEKNTKVLTARFKGNGARPYNGFSDSPGLLISVGQQKSQGEYLETSLMLIISEIVNNKLNSENQVPTTCYIIVTGALYRHNIAAKESLSQEKAYQESLKRAETWIKDCENTIGRIYTLIPALKQYVKFEFIKYNDLIQHRLFQEHLERVQQCHHESAFQEAMRTSVGEYSKRQALPANDSSDENLVENASFKFLEEESAGFSLISKIYPIRRIIYTSLCTNVLKATIEHENLVNKAFEWWEIRHSFKSFIEEDQQRCQSLLEKRPLFELITDSDNRSKFLDTALLKVFPNKLIHEQKVADAPAVRIIDTSQHLSSHKHQLNTSTVDSIHYESKLSPEHLSHLQETVNVQTAKISELTQVILVMQKQLDKIFKILNQPPAQNLPYRKIFSNNDHCSFLNSTESQENILNGTATYQADISTEYSTTTENMHVLK